MSMAPDDFSSAAHRYATHATIQRKVLEATLRGVRLENKTLLDAGAGPAVALPMLPKSTRMVALDRAEGMMQLAAEKCESVVADVSALPFLTQSFDAVLCNAVLHWVQDMPKTLKEFRRVTKPGGTLMIGCFVEGTLEPLRAAYLKAKLPPKVVHFPAPSILQDALQAGGWTIQKSQMQTWHSSHQNFAALLRHFKDIGARDHSTKKAEGLMTPRTFETLANAYTLKNVQGQVSAPWVVNIIHAQAL